MSKPHLTNYTGKRSSIFCTPEQGHKISLLLYESARGVIVPECDYYWGYVTYITQSELPISRFHLKQERRFARLYQPGWSVPAYTLQELREIGIKSELPFVGSSKMVSALYTMSAQDFADWLITELEKHL